MTFPIALVMSAHALVDDDAPLGDAPPPPEMTEDTAGDDVVDDPSVTGPPAPGGLDAVVDEGAAEPLVPALDAPAQPSAAGPSTAPQPWLWRFWSPGVHVGALIAPVPTVGVTLGAGVGGPWWSLRVEASIDGAEFEDLDILALPVSLAVAPCAHVPMPHDDEGSAWGFVGCATGTAGVVFVGGEYTGIGPYVGAGGRFGIEERGDDGGAWRATVQVEAPVVGYQLHAADGTAFTSPVVNFVVGVAADLPGG